MPGQHIMYIRTIWPEQRLVPASVVLMWGLDAFKNGDVDEKPDNARHAALLLNDAGLITLHKDWSR